MTRRTNLRFNLRLRRSDPEAIRETARNNNLPIYSITAVSVLDPYFYRR